MLNMTKNIGNIILNDIYEESLSQEEDLGL